MDEQRSEPDAVPPGVGITGMASLNNWVARDSTVQQPSIVNSDIYRPGTPTLSTPSGYSAEHAVSRQAQAGYGNTYNTAMHAQLDPAQSFALMQQAGNVAIRGIEQFGSKSFSPKSKAVNETVSALARSAHSDTGSVEDIEQLVRHALFAPIPARNPPSYEEALSCRSVAHSPVSSPRVTASPRQTVTDNLAGTISSQNISHMPEQTLMAPNTDEQRVGITTQPITPFPSPSSASKSARTSSMVTHRLARTSNNGSARTTLSENSLQDYVAQMSDSYAHAGIADHGANGSSAQYPSAQFHAPAGQIAMPPLENAIPSQQDSIVSPGIRQIITPVEGATDFPSLADAIRQDSSPNNGQGSAMGGIDYSAEAAAVDDVKAYVDSLLSLQTTPGMEQQDRHSNASNDTSNMGLAAVLLRAATFGSTSTSPRVSNAGAQVIPLDVIDSVAAGAVPSVLQDTVTALLHELQQPTEEAPLPLPLYEEHEAVQLALEELHQRTSNGSHIDVGEPVSETLIRDSAGMIQSGYMNGFADGSTPLIQFSPLAGSTDPAFVNNLEGGQFETLKPSVPNGAQVTEAAGLPNLPAHILHADPFNPGNASTAMFPAANERSLTLQSQQQGSNGHTSTGVMLSQQQPTTCQPSNAITQNSLPVSNNIQQQQQAYGGSATAVTDKAAGLSIVPPLPQSRPALTDGVVSPQALPSMQQPPSVIPQQQQQQQQQYAVAMLQHAPVHTYGVKPTGVALHSGAPDQGVWRPPPPAPLPAYPGLLYVDGRDTLQRPVIVLNSSALPERGQRDAALTAVLNALQPLVTQPYVLVVVNLLITGSGALNTGNNNTSKSQLDTLDAFWAISAYKKLARPYRKNVKQVLLICPSTLARLLLVLAKPLISRKADAKIKQVPRLPDIASVTNGEITLPSLGFRLLRDARMLPAPTPQQLGVNRAALQPTQMANPATAMPGAPFRPQAPMPSASYRVAQEATAYHVLPSGPAPARQPPNGMPGWVPAQMSGPMGARPQQVAGAPPRPGMQPMAFNHPHPAYAAGNPGMQTVVNGSAMPQPQTQPSYQPVPIPVNNVNVMGQARPVAQQPPVPGASGPHPAGMWPAPMPNGQMMMRPGMVPNGQFRPQGQCMVPVAGQRPVMMQQQQARPQGPYYPMAGVPAGMQGRPYMPPGPPPGHIQQHAMQGPGPKYMPAGGQQPPMQMPQPVHMAPTQQPARPQQVLYWGGQPMHPAGSAPA